jgi:MraZ protein
VVIGGEFMPDEGKEFLDNTNSEDQDRQTQAGSRLGFIGVYNHSIDGKGRVIIPQPFRNLLGERIIVGVNMAQDSIAIYPFEAWKEKVDMLTGLSHEDVSAEYFLARFAMYSFDGLSFDGQGRVLLPAALREQFLKDTQGVQVSGTTEYVRLVSDQQAQAERERFISQFPDPLKAISDIQARARNKYSDGK